MTKGTLEDVVERSKVEFPRALSLTGVKRLFKKMETYLGADICYDVSYTNDGVSSYANLQVGGKIRVEIFGKLTSDGFRSYPYIPGGDKIKGFEFDRISGYNIGEYRKEIVALWDRVRKYVNDNLSH